MHGPGAEEEQMCIGRGLKRNNLSKASVKHVLCALQSLLLLFRTRSVRIRVSSPRRSLTGWLAGRLASWLAGWPAGLPDGSPMDPSAGQVGSSQPSHGRGKSFAKTKKEIKILDFRPKLQKVYKNTWFLIDFAQNQ